MAAEFTEYQKQVNRLVSQEESALAIVGKIFDERIKEIHKLWLDEIEKVPFDSERLRAVHKGATEIKKLLNDLAHARLAFEEAQATTTEQKEGDPNAGQ